MVTLLIREYKILSDERHYTYVQIDARFYLMVCNMAHREPIVEHNKFSGQGQYAHPFVCPTYLSKKE